MFIQRKNTPFDGRWAIPGGYVEVDESLESAAMRTHEGRPAKLYRFREDAWPKSRRGGISSKERLEIAGSVPPTAVSRLEMSLTMTV